MTSWINIKVTDGTDQDSRKMPALEVGYFNVDEFTFEELLAMGAEFSSAINFFDLQNKVNGNWSDLFTADEAVIMAMILSIDTKSIESDFLTISYNDQEKLIKCILELATKINFWFSRLEICPHKSGNVLAQKIAAIIDEKLAIELHTVKDIASHTNNNLSAHDINQFSEFGTAWRLNGDEDKHASPKTDSSEFEYTLNVHRQLRASFYIFLNSLSYLKTITPIFLQESLGSQQHDPAVGLFIVFLKLYEKAQNKLNTFTQRHLDFFYNKLLNTKNRGESPKSTYLLFKTLPGTNKALINKATEFSAGKDKSLNEIIYCADDNLVVTDAKVQSLATLYLQQDKLIAPECELGYITRIKSNHPPISGADAEGGGLLPWSLFGAEKKGINKIPSHNASLGFSVASQTLLLREGVRKIDIGVELKNTTHTSTKTLISDVLNCKAKAEFTRLFGQLFSRYLLTFSGCLTFEQKNKIIIKAHSILSESVSDEINELLQQDWQGIFYKLFQNAFCIQLTTDNGWLNIDDYIVVPYSEDAESNITGLRIKLSLGDEIEPITPYMTEVHGSSLKTKLPILQCCINPQAHFYPYTIFQDLAIDSLQINVDVKGIKNILAYNQHGRLDPASPFNPFGPLPTSNSFFVFGNYEIAKKHLIDLKMNLEWGDLPRHSGGFSEYYLGYATQYSNSIFKGEFTALSDNSWQPYKAIDKPCFKLFEAEEESSRPAANNALRINVVNHSKPIDAAVSEEKYYYGTKARCGFFRLSLIEPDAAFGHTEYPESLTKVLSANAKLKKLKLAAPNPPYTPLLNRISLNYKASSRIDPTIRGDERDFLTEKIIHMHPFGIETVYPSAASKPCYFLPQYIHEGNLFIGISATEIAGNLTLFFHMSEESSQETTALTPTISWFYLSANNWKPLSLEHVLSDATNGFLSSGAITLNIPKDINSDNSVMPGDCFWLRISCMQGASFFSSCNAVQTNAVKITKKMSADIGHQQLPENIKWSSIYSIAGIGSISQVSEPFGGSPKESDIELKTRISERLRHKNRAQLPWDYERLILKQFPEIKKVKCFSSISSTEETIKPGNVLIVVVPHTSSSIDEACTKVIVNSDKLNQIKSYVGNLSSPFAKIEVRNPVYEQVQVRCTVKFSDDLSDGVNTHRLNQDISDYICPWKKRGYQSRFGWSIRQRDMESYIRSLSYVEFITNFSMLHITLDNADDYTLFDTARSKTKGDAVIRPRYPWSLAIPAKKHFIEMQQTAKSVQAEITGVNELAVGGTFIISGSSEYGQEE